MRYIIIPVTPFVQNCTLFWCEKTQRGAFVDPGGDADELLAAAERSGVTVDKILLTHGHIDHVGATGELARTLGVPIEGPQVEDRFWIEALPKQSAMFGFPPVAAFEPDRWLVHGDEVRVGELALEVLHCPGHTPGHIVFFQREAQIACVGDVLFQGSIGRTDFPRGDYDALIRSIRQNLWPLGDAVTFIPGHGPCSTFGAERRSNPFVADR